MNKAIRIGVKEAAEDYDPCVSRFFGSPLIPKKWENDFNDDEIFLCQIRLSDIAELDEENRLPHEGYLYIFLHTDGGEYGLRADVRYCADEPEMVFDDFNAAVEGYERFSQTWLMDFSPSEESEACTRLFGIPSGYFGEDGSMRLLMQYDPLDNEMGFLDFIDGFIYFFFDEDESDLGKVTVQTEYS